MTALVDLVGQLSNPRDRLETLVDKGLSGSSNSRGDPDRGPKQGALDLQPAAATNSGQLSNPGERRVQLRLTPTDIEEIETAYRSGKTLRQIATAVGINRRTISAHLERRGVQRRANTRKMTHRDVAEASRLYAAGDSLKTVARAFRVDARTIAREFTRAGVSTRPSRGAVQTSR